MAGMVRVYKEQQVSVDEVRKRIEDEDGFTISDTSIVNTLVELGFREWERLRALRPSDKAVRK